jgi:hypothetical protein
MNRRILLSFDFNRLTPCSSLSRYEQDRNSLNHPAQARTKRIPANRALNTVTSAATVSGSGPSAWAIRRASSGISAPLTDWRGNSAYRLQAAQNLLQRFFLETQGEAGVSLQRGAA